MWAFYVSWIIGQGAVNRSPAGSTENRSRTSPPLPHAPGHLSFSRCFTKHHTWFFILHVVMDMVVKIRNGQIFLLNNEDEPRK